MIKKRLELMQLNHPLVVRSNAFIYLLILRLVYLLRVLQLAGNEIQTTHKREEGAGAE